MPATVPIIRHLRVRTKLRPLRRSTRLVLRHWKNGKPLPTQVLAMRFEQQAVLVERQSAN